MKIFQFMFIQEQEFMNKEENIVNKKKFFNSNYLLFIKSLFSKFLFVLGFIFLTLIISVFIYYFTFYSRVIY